jgi:hypothetical protein
MHRHVHATLHAMQDGGNLRHGEGRVKALVNLREVLLADRAAPAHRCARATRANNQYNGVPELYAATNDCQSRLTWTA